MSQENQAVLPDYDSASQNIFDGVHQRVFFHKMASYGYVPQNAKQASTWLEIAGKLRLVEEEATVKQASEAYDPFDAANAALDEVLSRSGYQSVQKAAHDEETIAIKHAAAQWAMDPDIYNSVLSMKAHEAEQIAQQLQLQR